MTGNGERKNINIKSKEYTAVDTIATDSFKERLKESQVIGK